MNQIPEDIYKRLVEISDLKFETVPKLKELLKELKPKKQRTSQQNRALYKFFSLKAEQCRDAGVTAQMAFNKTTELEMNEEIMKSIWKYTQKALYGTDSTADLEKQEQIDNIYEHLTRFFAEKFNLEGIPFPHKEKDEVSAIESMNKGYEYPTEDAPADKF